MRALVDIVLGASPPTSTLEVQHGRSARESAQLAIQCFDQCKYLILISSMLANSLVRNTKTSIAHITTPPKLYQITRR